MVATRTAVYDEVESWRFKKNSKWQVKGRSVVARVPSKSDSDLVPNKPMAIPFHHHLQTKVWNITVPEAKQDFLKHEETEIYNSIMTV
jgi:hypothetical protein